MVNDRSPALDLVFQALADTTRRTMLRRLAAEPLAEPLDMSLAAASKHIKVLERAGLVQREIQGRTHLCRLDARPMHGGMEWIRFYEKFWNERLDALESILKSERKKK
jgi:DNA-binding transcriptional ArsR family regulator